MASNPLLKNLIEITSNIADAYTTALFQLDSHSQQLKVVDYLSLSPNFKPDVAIDLGQGLIGQVAEEKQSKLLDFSLETSPTLEIYGNKENLKCFLAVPINRDGLIGVLVVDSKEGYSFSTKMQKLVTGLAEQMAWHLTKENEFPNQDLQKEISPISLIEWGQYLAESPNRKTLAERFLQTSQNHIPFDALAVVWFKSDGTGRVTQAKGWKQPVKSFCIISGESICGSFQQNSEAKLIHHPWSTGRFIFVKDEKPEPFESVIISPLIGKKGLQGLVVCAHKSADGMNYSDLQKLMLLTTLGAQALDYSEITQQWENDKNHCQISGLPNYRFLLKHLNIIEKEAFKDNAICVITIHIKNLNSIYEADGIEQGDRLINQIVSQASESLALPKFIFKFSEDTLIILLAGKDKESLDIQNTLLQDGIQNPNLLGRDKLIQPEIRLGLARYPKDGKHLEGLISASRSRAFDTKEETE